MITEFFKNYINGNYDEVEELKQYINNDIEKVVFNNIIGKDEFEVKFIIEDEFDKLMNQYVPGSGTANTMYGEIIRGINKLIYRYLNDGDEIETGYYSGIIYGLRERFGIQFMPDGECVRWYGSDYEKINDDFGYIGTHKKYWKGQLSSNTFFDYLIHDMMFATILLKYIDCYETASNSDDISEYYQNIINFIVKDDIIKTFKEFDFDITNHFGCYDKSWRFWNEININDTYENFHIQIVRNYLKFKFVSRRYIFEFDSNNLNELKENLEKYKSMMAYLYQFVIDDNKIIDEDFVKSLGYNIEKDERGCCTIK